MKQETGFTPTPESPTRKGRDEWQKGVKRRQESRGRKPVVWGFTLIEVVVYLGLFSILLVGAIAASYNMFESTNRNQTKAFIEQEGIFLIGKIEWALGNAKAVNAPLTAGALLSINSWDASIGTIVIDMDPVTHADIRIARGVNPPQPLNSSRITVSNLLFTHTYSNTANPESISVNFTLSARMENGISISENFSTKKYLRR